ncbi:hypothetical protein IFM47457_05795 [Aspergillus lentulus]|nr:hypothetical protein IFM47457_05795 [Aspergillus lentulus]
MAELEGCIKVIYRYKVIKDKTVHPDGAILIDLAIYKEGVPITLYKYRVINFAPMSNKDPVVLLQPSEIIEDKQIAAYKNILKRYSHYLSEEHHLLSPLAKVWVTKRLARIKN